MSDYGPLLTLFECEQCSNQEWRPVDNEPWLCVVCGYMRWSVVVTSDETGTEADEGTVNRSDEEVERYS